MRRHVCIYILPDHSLVQTVHLLDSNYQPRGEILALWGKCGEGRCKVVGHMDRRRGLRRYPAIPLFRQLIPLQRRSIDSTGGLDGRTRRRNRDLKWRD